MRTQLMPGLRMTLALTVLTGLAYPGVVTGICQAVFPRQANGSLVERNGKTAGSEWIGQRFTRPEYFHGRPSAAGAEGYDASASGGSNLGPTSAKLAARVKAAVEEFRRENPEYRGEIPADVVTASASGLDPHVSVAGAEAQAARVAAARGLEERAVRALVGRLTEGRDLGFLGEPRVNVLKLNLVMDRGEASH